MFLIKKSSLYLLSCAMFVFMTISFYSGGFTDHIIFGQGYGDDLSNTPKIINSLLKFPLYLFTLYLMFKYWGNFKLALSDARYFLIFCLFCFLNSFYSTSMPDSLFKLFSLVMTFYVAFGLAIIFLHEESTQYLTKTLLILLLGSIVYIFFLPEYGLMSASDDFEYTALVGEKQGVFKHKNIFGGVSAFAFLYALYYLKRKDAYRRALMTASIICLLLANSATKIFAILGIIIFLKVVYFLSKVVFIKYHKVTIYFALSAVIVLVIASVNIAESLVGFAGRDLTFTGRTVIWEHALSVAQDSLVFGYGLSSIWGTDLGYIPELPFYIPIHSHNSFVETLVTSGSVGVLLLLSFILKSFGHFSKYMATNENSKFFLSVLLLALIDSFFEYTLFRGNSILFLLAMFSMFLVTFTARKETGRN